MIKKSNLFLVLAFGLYFSGYSQDLPEKNFDLKRVLIVGLENNYAIKKSKLDEEGAAYQRKEIIGSGLPQIHGYGNYNNFLEISPMGIPGGLFNPDSDPSQIDVIAFGVPQSVQAGFQLNQLIFSHSYLVGLKAAKTSEEFYLLTTQMSEEDILYDLAMNYYGIMEMELQKQNLEANLQKLQNLEKILQVQYDNDLAKKVDYNRVTVNLTTLQASLDDLNIGISQGKSYLKLLMGIPINTPFEVEQENFDIDLGKLLQIGTQADLQNRTDLRLLNKQQELSGLDIKNIQSGYYPSLVGFADINYNTFANEFSFLTESKRWYRGSLIGLRLEVPIFDGFQRKNKIAQAKVRRLKLDQDLNQASQAADMEYQNAVKKLSSSIRSAEAQEANLGLAEEVYGQTELLYTEGLSPLTDLLDAETALRESRSAYHNQIIQVKTALIDVYKSTGEIKKMME